MPEARSERCDDAAELAPARQTLYMLLAGAFSAPPQAETFAAWRDFVSQGAAAEWVGDAAAAALRNSLRTTLVGGSAEKQLRQEFMNLFKIPGGQYLAPYESVYRDTRDIEGRQVSGLVMGPSAIDVQTWYRLAALEISDSFRDLPDHIGLELSYMAHLCRKEAEFAASGDPARLARAREMQRDFLAAHVDSWIAALRDKLYEKSENAYFRAVVDLAVDFVRRDLAGLERSIGPSERWSAPRYASAPAGG